MPTHPKPVPADTPVAVVSPGIAEAFGMGNLVAAGLAVVRRPGETPDQAYARLHAGSVAVNASTRARAHVRRAPRPRSR